MHVIHINIIGAGGTGAWFAEQIMRVSCSLRRPSAGTTILINLIDNDKVELKNLVRQHFVGIETIGALKVDVLRMLLEKIYAAAAISVSPDLKDPETEEYMPAIRVSSYPTLVMENMEGKLDATTEALLFPQNSAAAITVMCVDNNLTRKVVEKHYKRRLERRTDTWKYDLFHAACENLVAGADELTADSLEIRLNALFSSDKGESPVARIVSKDPVTGIVSVTDQKEFPSHLPIVAKESDAECIASTYAHIDAGNDDTSFMINGAFNTQLADYSHVYDKDLSVPDSMLSCAVRAETTNTPQTTTMNMMAATHLVGVVAKWLTAKRAQPIEKTFLGTHNCTRITTLNDTGKHEMDFVHVHKVGESPTEASVHYMKTDVVYENPDKEYTLRHNAVVAALAAAPSGVVTAKSIQEHVVEHYAAAGGVEPVDEGVVQVYLDSILEFMLLSYESFVTQFSVLGDALETQVNGAVITGDSMSSRAIALGRTQYAKFRKTLAEAAGRST